ncbi:hypothetical protein [Stieleria varia]|uniref:Tetratricopeptide repeat protein n=1 Tax=Stieleria varia TaxID=2528005 RepID=A0A5C6B207_9BACT|nr:hypothetical protein [Stieleria varia]TWU05509.1 hypothetical protein Pla52n_12230 [Stieleria varia]
MNNNAPKQRRALNATMPAMLCAALVMVLSTQVASAQMITTQAPFQQIGSSFHEQNGVQWSIGGPNFQANFGGGNVQAPFGNPDPNSGLRTGIGFGSGPIRGSLGLNFAQGSSRSISSTTPSLTTMNGYPGSISSQTIRPFVTGVTPVVSGGGYGQPLEQMRATEQAYTAAQNQYLQQRMQANADAQQTRALEVFNRGQRAEAEGDLKKARANYRLAFGMAAGPLKFEVAKRLQARGW